MEKMKNLNLTPNNLLFNSPLETGVRALIVLNACYPKKIDLLQLTWFDHLVVHTADIDGPISLHPGVPSRNGELLVRRRIIEDGLKMMRSLHLINFYSNEQGLVYQASDEALPFIELMRSKYYIALIERAEWLANNICCLDTLSIEKLIDNKIGKWNIEFQNESGTESKYI